MCVVGGAAVRLGVEGVGRLAGRVERLREVGGSAPST